MGGGGVRGDVLSGDQFDQQIPAIILATSLKQTSEDSYLQNSDVGGEDGVDRILDVGVLFLHPVGVRSHRPAVV